MKISLREAGRLRREVEQWLAREKPEPMQALSIHDPKVGETVSLKRQEVLDRTTAWLEMLDVLYQLRQEIGQVNAESGVDALLAEQNRLQKELALYGELTAQEGLSDEVLLAELAAEREKDSRAEGRGDRQPFNVVRRPRRLNLMYGVDRYNVLTPEEVKQFEGDMQEDRRRLRETQDDLLRLNMDTEVELPAEVEKALKDRGIL